MSDDKNKRGNHKAEMHWGDLLVDQSTTTLAQARKSRGSDQETPT
jgi:hypothetical protein